VTTAAAGDLEPGPQRDYLSEAGARELAARIQAFWCGKGHQVEAWPELRDGAWTVRSSLGAAGLPPAAATPASVAAGPADELVGDDQLPEAPMAAGSITMIPEPGRCLWPNGDPGDRDFRWCGSAVARPGRPYCRKHQALARHRRTG
jgi:hypothetical protein